MCCGAFWIDANANGVYGKSVPSGILLVGWKESELTICGS